MKKLIKENMKWICFLGGTFLIVIPIIIYLLSSVPLLPTGGNNDWAGFWGGYLGAVIGAFVAIFVMEQTIKNEKNVRKEEREEEFLSDIIELIAEFAAQVNKSNCNLLRFHATGQSEWNYEAVYGMTEVAKLANILYIKMKSNQGKQYIFIKCLLDKVLEVEKETETLHEVNVKDIEMLYKQADEVNEHLSEMMEQAMEFVVSMKR